MISVIQKIGVGSALLSFIFCLSAGLWILTKTGMDRGNDVVSTGIALYFIGKAFFVGPMLLIVSGVLPKSNPASTRPATEHKMGIFSL